MCLSAACYRQATLYNSNRLHACPPVRLALACVAQREDGLQMGRRTVALLKRKSGASVCRDASHANAPFGTHTDVPFWVRAPREPCGAPALNLARSEAAIARVATLRFRAVPT